MTLPIVIIALQLMLGTFHLIAPTDYPTHSQGLKATVIPFNLAGMPLTINNAVAANRSTDAWLEFSITNVSQGHIAGTYLRVFVVDGSGKIITTEDGFSGDTIDAGTTLQSRVRIGEPIEQNGLSIVAVTKVVGQSGVWETELSELERAVRARISHKPDIALNVGFEPNRVVTDADRGEIFKLIIEDIINDDDKAAKLKDRSNLIVLREDLHFALPEIENIKLTILDQDELQKAADNKGRVVYLILRPLVVEGSHVLARVSFRDSVARRPGNYVPFKYTYLFTCAKKDGRWSIEKSLGYAES